MLDPRGLPAAALRHLGYPLLLLAAVAVTAGAIVAELPLLDLLPPIFAGVIGSVLLLERLVPHRRDWHPTGREVRRDGIYLLVALVSGALGQLVAGSTALVLATGANGLPPWLSIPLALVLADLGAYLFHRRVHRAGWWWKEHGIHHVQTKVNALNANATHVLDVLVGTVVIYTPLVLLGFSAEAIFVVNVARALHTIVAHANADLCLGWLGHLVLGPEHHRLHHSPAPGHGGNYATVLTLWDRVFGTYAWEPGGGAEVVGVREPGAFPDPQRVWVNLAYPFRRRPAPARDGLGVPSSRPVPPAE